jgi:hypothetical protein
MSIAELERTNETVINTPEKEALKQALLDEVFLRFKLAESGIRYDPEQIKKFQDTSRSQFRPERAGAANRFGLGGFQLPHGISASGRLNQWTPYSLVVENDKPVLYDEDQPIAEVTFNKADPIVTALLDQDLSTGGKFRDIAGITVEGQLGVSYSDECSLAEAGEACLFCGKAAVGAYSGKPFLKQPNQIAEVYRIARKAGYANNFKITGGFVPERRELEYYLDVVDAIRADHPDAYIDTVIGAPADLSLLDKYKEAGVTNMDIHIEIWHKDIFAALVPGKDKRNGGWRHWVDAIEYSVELFGKGRVHTAILAGLEPKQSALEGIEYFASKGVVCKTNTFGPRPGTPLEGYRTPEASWHFDLNIKAAEIYRRYGFTTDQIRGGSHPGRPVFDIFDINAGHFDGNKLRQYKCPSLD